MYTSITSSCNTRHRATQRQYMNPGDGLNGLYEEGAKSPTTGYMGPSMHHTELTSWACSTSGHRARSIFHACAGKYPMACICQKSNVHCLYTGHQGFGRDLACATGVLWARCQQERTPVEQKGGLALRRSLLPFSTNCQRTSKRYLWTWRLL